jgi:hypothetical protein
MKSHRPETHISMANLSVVIPAQAGIHLGSRMDPGLRRGDARIGKMV